MKVTELTLKINVASTEEAADVLNRLAGMPQHTVETPAEAADTAKPDGETKAKRGGKPAAVAVPEPQPTGCPGQLKMNFEESQPQPQPQPAAAQEVTIDTLRELLAAKINEHRPEIKAKLTECGAQNIKGLDKDKYAEMYEFLKSI